MSDTGFEVLHGLALRRKADLAALGQTTGLEAAAIEAALAPALADGRAIAARGLFVLAPAGAAWLQQQYPQVFAGHRADAALIEAYARFEVINRELKGLITRWQNLNVGGQSVVNDHRDAAYDGRILDQLSALHGRAESLIARMAASLPRLQRYAQRLGEALERAEGGDIDWVSGVRCDSYHTVWFEMHEDLLRLLGRSREE
jgi:hypothetical protein